MKVKRHSRWLYAVVVVVLAGAAAGLVRVDPSSAGNAGKTYTIKTVKALGSTWVAASPKGMRMGHLSPGDRLFETNGLLLLGGGRLLRDLPGLRVDVERAADVFVADLPGDEHRVVAADLP